MLDTLIIISVGVVCVGMGGGVWYGMVWFWLLGISASVLAGREAGLPHQLPGPGATLNPEHQDQKAHIAFTDRYTLFSGWSYRQSPIVPILNG